MNGDTPRNCGPMNGDTPGGVDGVGVAGGGRPYLVRQPAGYLEYQLPVSLKAVIVWKGRVPLLQNERDEWELPGGKLELGEDPRSCLAREIEEELGWPAAVGSPLHAWVYEIRPDRHVFVLTYRHVRRRHRADPQPRAQGAAARTSGRDRPAQHADAVQGRHPARCRPEMIDVGSTSSPRPRRGPPHHHHRHRNHHRGGETSPRFQGALVPRSVGRCHCAASPVPRLSAMPISLVSRVRPSTVASW